MSFNLKIKFSITRYHFLQTLFAGITITFIILLGETFSNNVINAAIGSSVALVFLYPGNKQNRFRSLFGGNVVAIITFLFLHFLFLSFNQDLFITIYDRDFHLFSGLSFTLCILIMSITDTEHIPAAGTSIGLSVNNIDYTLILFILFSILFLYALRININKYGKNLF